MAIYCVLYSTLYGVHCILYSVQFILFTVQCTPLWLIWTNYGCSAAGGQLEGAPIFGLATIPVSKSHTTIVLAHYTILHIQFNPIIVRLLTSHLAPLMIGW